MSNEKSIVEPTREVIDAASAGDLTRRLEASLDGPELRAMAVGIHSLLDSMAAMVHGIKSTAAAQNMIGQARELGEDMGRYRVSRTQRAERFAAGAAVRAARIG